MANDAAITLPAITVQGTRDLHGDSDITLPKLSLSANASQGMVIGTTLTLPALTIDIEAGKLIDLLLPSLDILGVGFQGEYGIYDQKLPQLDITGIGTVHANGDINITLPEFSLDVDGLAGVLGTLSSGTRLPQFTIYARSIKGENGNADLTLPMFTMNNTGYLSQSGTLTQELNSLIVEAYADIHTNRII